MNKRYWIIGSLVALSTLVAAAVFFYQAPVIPVKTTLLENGLSIQHWEQNGASVHFVKMTGLPIVDIDININAGSARDEDHPGLAALTTYLLDKGTVHHTADQIAEGFEEVGALYESNLSRDRITLSLRSLSDPKLLKPAVALLANLVNTPTFPQEALDKVRQQLLIEIRHQQQTIGSFAQQTFFQALYDGHPYGNPVLGTEPTLSTLQQSDLIEFHQRYFVGKNLSVVIVGDLTEAQAQKYSDELTRSLAVGEKAPDIASITPVSSQQYLPFQSKQTHILLGQPCLAYNDPDYFPLLIGNYVLGGNFLSSRLAIEVREKRGLAYHVGSLLIEQKEKGPFAITAETKNEQAEEALNVIQKTLAEFLEKGPTEAELVEAKKGLINAFPLKINTNKKIVNVVSLMAFYGLPEDYLSTYQQRIESVSLTDVQEAVQRRLGSSTIVVVGNS